jgi:hypothetical protein
MPAETVLVVSGFTVVIVLFALVLSGAIMSAADLERRCRSHEPVIGFREPAETSRRSGS